MRCEDTLPYMISRVCTWIMFLRHAYRTMNRYGDAKRAKPEARPIGPYHSPLIETCSPRTRCVSNRPPVSSPEY
jgi:hypothetical protein